MGWHPCKLVAKHIKIGGEEGTNNPFSLLPSVIQYDRRWWYELTQPQNKKKNPNQDTNTYCKPKTNLGLVPANTPVHQPLKKKSQRTSHSINHFHPVSHHPTTNLATKPYIQYPVSHNNQHPDASPRSTIQQHHTTINTQPTAEWTKDPQPEGRN